MTPSKDLKEKIADLLNGDENLFNDKQIASIAQKVSQIPGYRGTTPLEHDDRFWNIVKQTDSENAALAQGDNLIESYDLNNGNAETYVQDGELTVSVEGSNNTTIPIYLPVKDVNRKNLAIAFNKAVNDFDPDEEFDELWSPEFGEHNSFTPDEFHQMLVDDKTELAYKAGEALDDLGIKHDMDYDLPAANVTFDVGDLSAILYQAGFKNNAANIQTLADSGILYQHMVDAYSHVLKQLVQKHSEELNGLQLDKPVQRKGLAR